MPQRRLRAVRRAVLAALVATLVLSASLLRAGPVAADSLPLLPLSPDQVSHRLSREVFGYLPYWQIDGGTDAYLPYDLLTSIAFFGITQYSDGTINTSLSGYKSYIGDRATTIINHAHALGVRTVITFESFGTTKNAAFFTNPTAQATFIEQAVALMQARGADGINVDVELISGTYFPAYGAFIAALRQAILATNPNAQISVATNGNTSGAKMAAMAIANGADRAFLMGYDYRSGGSNPVGSIDPLVRADGGLSLSRSLDLYAAYGAPLDHVLLGLPLYGRTWPTVSPDLRAARQTDTATYGYSHVFYPSTLPTSATGATFDYDPVEESARLTRYDSTRGTWIQTYYNDPTTLAAKISLANSRSLAGTGFWALGYEQGQSGYWDAVATAFAASQLTALLIAPGATRSLDVTVNPVWQDGGSPTTDIRLSNDGVTWSDWQPIGPAIAWHLADGLPDGQRTVYAEVRNASGAVSTTTRGIVIVDTTPPTVAGPVVSPILHSSAGAAGELSAAVRWNAADPASGVASYALELSQDGEAYAPAPLAGPGANSVTTLIVPGHAYRWRVTATDAAGNVGAPVEGNLVTARSFQDSASAVRYSSGWRRGSSSSASGGTVTYASIAGASATFRFVGRSVTLIAPFGPTRGVARVFIDGVRSGGVNEYSAVGHGRVVALTRSWTVSGSHTITIQVAGTAGHPRIDVDAFVVLS